MFIERKQVASLCVSRTVDTGEPKQKFGVASCLRSAAPRECGQDNGIGFGCVALRSAKKGGPGVTISLLLAVPEGDDQARMVAILFAVVAIEQ